ncbi:inosine-uridine preferring nucleoside hydrolase isoform X2 [Biomphalaria glabrata]|uniref:C2H2-type domain-containing protein n=2 Tax=Biomphalaria glabrata TaxID=6526 RepID=A0A2C9LR04_BIOGL|nr:inosine-uridine preferring nucleoside hydrolase isoform X2 [Biomphalaria glabrata]
MDKEIIEQNFKLLFTNYVREYCGGSQNSYTLTIEKRDRIINCLRNAKNEPSARFRFWVRAKGYRIVQSADGEDILALPPKGNDPNDNLFKRVATIDEFFDIIYSAHSENGHVGQAQTYRAIKAIYALVPRVLIIKFIEMCPQCSNTHTYATKRRNTSVQDNIISPDKLAGAFAVIKRDPDDIEETAFVDSEEASSNQQEVANALSEILAEKLPGAEIETMVHIETEEAGTSQVVLFPCHLCKAVFNKKKILQKHINSHQDFKPAVPLQKASPNSKKRKFNVAFHTVYPTKTRRATVARRRVILDMDSSPTAAQAIVLAASRPDIDLMAINCVAGRVSVLNACENALRVLKACGRDDVQVCRGAEKSLLGLCGRDENLPGLSWSRKIEGHVQAEHSVSSLIRSVNENPGEISLICMGPLTNLALALRLDPLVANHLKELYIVGGNVEAQGDISACAEQNFMFDPEAAHIVLQEIRNAHILPYEISQRHCMPFANCVSWLNNGTEISSFLFDCFTSEELSLQAKTGMVSPEVFAVSMMIDSTIVLEKDQVFATVELKGDYTRGQMVVDKRGFLNKPANVFIVKNMDLGKTQALFGSVFSMIEESESLTLTPITLAGPGKDHVPILLKEIKINVV